MNQEEAEAAYFMAAAESNVLPEAEEVVMDLDDMIELLRLLYWHDAADGDPEEFDEFAEMKLTDLWDQRKTAQGLIEAAKKIKATIDQALAAKLGPAGVARLDDFKVQVARDKKLVVTDPEGFVEWIGEDWTQVFNISGSNIRTKALRAIAEKRDLDPDHAFDAYCAYEPGDPRLVTIPLDKVGQKWRNLEHGQTEGALEE